MMLLAFFWGFCGGGVPWAAPAVHAQLPECAVFTPDRQKSTAPDDEIAKLKAGNERFTAGESVHCDLSARVRKTAGKPSPLSSLIRCFDCLFSPDWGFYRHFLVFFCDRLAGLISA